jgi:hypothetical protein
MAVVAAVLPAVTLTASPDIPRMDYDLALAKPRRGGGP